MRVLLLLSIAVLVTAGVALPGCSSDDGAGPGSANPLEFPFAVGNRWTFDVTTTTRGGYEETLEVLGTGLVDGQTYWRVEERNTAGAEVDTLWLRQDGQVLYLWAAFDTGTGRGGGIDLWLGRITRESLPWRFADFAASAGTEWLLAEADTTDDFGQGVQTFSVHMSGKSLGRTGVSVPAGEYPNAYEGVLSFETRLDGELQFGSTQGVWFVNGVGMVRNRISDFQEGGVPTTTTTTSDLKSVTLVN